MTTYCLLHALCSFSSSSCVERGDREIPIELKNLIQNKAIKKIGVDIVFSKESSLHRVFVVDSMHTCLADGLNLNRAYEGLQVRGCYDIDKLLEHWDYNTEIYRGNVKGPLRKQGNKTGLDDMTVGVLGVVLDKSETLSDWGHIPLTDPQITCKCSSSGIVIIARINLSGT